MSLDRILEYGIGTAVIFLGVLPMAWKLLRMLQDDRQFIVRSQERIVETLDNHLSTIARTLAVIEERLRGKGL